MTHLHNIGMHVAQPYLDAMGAAMMRACPDLRVTGTSIVHGQGGASYEALVRECRWHGAAGNAWEGMLDRYGPPTGDPDAYGIVCWSAGYGAARELLRVEGASVDVALWAFLDSIYGTMGPDGEPVEAELRLWAKLAREAVAGGRVVLIGTSDIDYVEHLPPGDRYLSTGHMARAIGATCGAQAAPVAYAGPRPKNAPTHELERGGLLVQLHDTVPGVGAVEHTAAVLPTGWGVEMMARGALLLRSELGGSGGGGEHALGGAAQGAEAPPSSPPTSASELLPEARGPDVGAMQRDIGCRADGVWGPATSRALTTLQRGAGLPVRTTWGDVERVALAAMPRGIDVSHHQLPIDWERVRAAGYEFAIVRSGDGTLVDRRAREHWEAAGRAGMLRMAYHFLRAGQPIAPQVSVAVTTLPEAIGWWVDVEDGRSAAQLAAGAPAQYHAREEIDLAHRMLLATAKRVGDYSAWGWWEACKLGVPAGAVWNAGPNNDHVFGGAESWLCWQPDARPVPGVTGACDVDVWSSRSALAEWSV